MQGVVFALGFLHSSGIVLNPYPKLVWCLIDFSQSSGSFITPPYRTHGQNRIDNWASLDIL